MVNCAKCRKEISAFTSYHINSLSPYAGIFPEYKGKYACKTCYNQLKTEADSSNKSQVQNNNCKIVLCKYHKNGSCQAISDNEKRHTTIEEFCLKKSCCYKCTQYEKCGIKCTYLGKQDPNSDFLF